MNGQTIAILESRLGSQMAGLIERRGGRTLLAPALREVPDTDAGQIQRFIDDLVARPPQLAIFQTGVGTQALFEAADGLAAAERLKSLLADTTVLVRGPKPAGVLRGRGVRIDLAARDPFTTAQIVELLEPLPLQGARVVVQRHGDTNEKLDQVLGQRGATVVEIPTYRWALPEDTGPLTALLDALERGEVRATVFTNAVQVQNLFEFARLSDRAASLADRLNATLVASIGPVCSDALRRHGIRVGLEPSPPKLGPLIAALAQALDLAD